MSRHSYIVWAVTAIILLLLVAIIQMIRVDGFYKVFPAKGVKTGKVETMSSQVKPTGEELQVTLVQEIAQDPIMDNIARTLTYAKIPFSYKKPAETINLIPSPYHILVITDRVLPYEQVKQFVANGGRLFVAQRFLDEEWNELVGIEENQGYLENDAYGLQMQKPLFPGYETIADDNGAIPNSMLDVVLSEKAQVYISAEGIPMLWTHQYGKGKVVYWNATFLVTKYTRGLITQSIGLAPPQFVSGQAAMKVMFIDDFPAPFPAGFTDMITKDYKLTTQEFFEQIWWPDLKKIADQERVHYTNVFIGTYQNNDRVTASQLIQELRHPMIFFGRDALRRGDELGFHGYNHQPLVTADEPMDPNLQYTPWQSSEHMRKSIRKAQEAFSHYFPRQVVHSYVPPSNIVNQTGLQALKDTLPSLRVIASLYDAGEGVGVFEQEFEADAQYQDVFYLPRISSGYKQGAFEMLAITDAIANFGMFNHFIHPDDVLDVDRADKGGWKQMQAGLSDLMKRIRTKYPSLRAYRAFDAANTLQQYQQAQMYVHYKQKEISISGRNLVNPSHAYIRLENGAIAEGRFAGYRVKKLAEGLYDVQLTKPFVTIEVKEVK
ncbi:DUF2194 domain-containing protein [Ectobacillus sp. JY-23]|uniref:DUF2194 domain-containing protein n=1 Tax=Ectobacillus sp. JY-23 TaxID=2933872 RepID=UPI001FF32BB2|nr:DUF2194 domain-containing protein [Ectobacillus sp. JY-23]UOY92218.1 DUF2194 domain-containing protein [Ectobacillus sp. JY-23]